MPQDDGVQQAKPLYHFNSSFELTRREEIRLSKIRHAGVQYFGENGKVFPKNPGQANENLMQVQNELVALYYSIPTSAVMDLSSKKFEELYERIKEIDPLGLTKEQEKAKEQEKSE